MTDRIPLLLLPGLLLDRRLFATQIEALAEQAVAQVADLSLDASIAAMGARVLAGAPPRFALCGLSMGGYVAFEIMRQAPERVVRLALVDTQARRDSEALRQSRVELMALAERGEFAEVPKRLLPRFVHSDRLDDAALTAAIEAMAHSVGRDGFLRQERAILDRIDSRAHLAAIDCPTLVLCGREDVIAPPEVHHEMAAAIPNATLVVLPRCGHLSPLEKPHAVTVQLRAWLDGV